MLKQEPRQECIRELRRSSSFIIFEPSCTLRSFYPTGKSAWHQRWMLLNGFLHYSITRFLTVLQIRYCGLVTWLNDIWRKITIRAFVWRRWGYLRGDLGFWAESPTSKITDHSTVMSGRNSGAIHRQQTPVGIMAKLGRRRPELIAIPNKKRVRVSSHLQSFRFCQCLQGFEFHQRQQKRNARIKFSRSRQQHHLNGR
jgi:hypothetical protein